MRRRFEIVSGKNLEIFIGYRWVKREYIIVIKK